MMRNSIKASLKAVALCTLLGSGGAFAQPDGGRPDYGQGYRFPRPEPNIGRELKKMDLDEDGIITLEEFILHATERFDALDGDGDGFITKEEVHAASKNRRRRHMDPEKIATRLIKRFDENKDGTVSADEFKGPQDRFDQWDANGDGLVTTEELAESLPRGPGRGAERGERGRNSNWQGRGDRGSSSKNGGRGNWGDRQGNNQSNGNRFGDFFERIDADSDGQISAEEFPGPEDRFSVVDADGDGYLTKEEIQTAHNNRGGQNRGTQGASQSKHGKRGNRKDMSSEDRAARFLDRFDADEDGQISAEEFTGPEERFESMDVDGDGYLTTEEFLVRKKQGKRGKPGSGHKQDPVED